MRAEDSTWQTYADGADALKTAIDEEGSIDRRMMVAQARLELCRQAFLSMVCTFAYGKQKLQLAKRAIEAEVLEREFCDCDAEVCLAIDDLISISPSLGSHFTAAGIEIESRRAAFVAKFHTWKNRACLIGLEIAGIAVYLGGWSACLIGVYEMSQMIWTDERMEEVSFIPDLAPLLPAVRLVLGSYGAPAILYRISRLHDSVSRSFQSHTEVVESPHQTHDCPICYTDLFDFAPDDLGTAEAIQNENDTDPAQAPVTTKSGRWIFSSFTRKLKSLDKFHKAEPDLSALTRFLKSPRKYFKVTKRNVPARPWPRPVRCPKCKQSFHAECLSHWAFCLERQDQSPKCPFCQNTLSQPFRLNVLRPLVDKHRVQKLQVRQRRSLRSST